MIVIARHQSVLQKLGLSTLQQVQSFQGETVKVHGKRRSRDILRIPTIDDTGAPLVLYLKRTWRPHLKDGLRSLLQRGQVWSISRREWENSLSLQHAGLKTAPLVAFGESCGWFGERFSFLITESVPCNVTLQQFLEYCHVPVLRRRVLEALARYVSRVHEAGFAMPDLYTRHLYMDFTGDKPAFYLIDMARLDHPSRVSLSRRVRDLAALNVTAPLRDVSSRERLRFLQAYNRPLARRLVHGITLRMKHLLQRRKHADFEQSAAVPPQEETPLAIGL